MGNSPSSLSEEQIFRTEYLPGRPDNVYGHAAGSIEGSGASQQSCLTFSDLEECDVGNSDTTQQADGTVMTVTAAAMNKEAPLAAGFEEVDKTLGLQDDVSDRHKPTNSVEVQSLPSTISGQGCFQVEAKLLSELAMPQQNELDRYGLDSEGVDLQAPQTMLVKSPEMSDPSSSAASSSQDMTSVRPHSVKDQSMQLLKYRKIHNKLKSLEDRQDLASYRYMIAIIPEGKTLRQIRSATDVVWLVGVADTTIETIRSKYARHVGMEKCCLLLGDWLVQDGEAAVELDHFNDKLVVLKCIKEEDLQLGAKTVSYDHLMPKPASVLETTGTEVIIIED